MELLNNSRSFNPQIEKDSYIFLHLSKQEQIIGKSPSFLRQSINSIENLAPNSKEFNPYLSEQNNSIPELKDLNQERISRLKSRTSSNSKSPKSKLNFNGNINNNQTNFLKDLENQWKILKDDHQNFISKNGKKNSFISNSNDREEIFSVKGGERSISPSKLLNFNQSLEDSTRFDAGNKYYQNSEKKVSNLLTPNKFLKKSVPHSKINLELCKKILNTNPIINSERNTPEKSSKNRVMEKREYSPCVNPSNYQNNNKDKDNQQHFKLILNKYANIYKKNIEIDLTNLNTNKSTASKNIFHKISSEDDKKSLNNSKISTNTGKSENLKKNSYLKEKIQENKLKIANSQNSLKNLDLEKNHLNEKINDKLKKINTTKIYLKDDDISMDIPNESKDLDSVKKKITQSPQYFNKKHSFGSTNLNSENLITKNEKFNKSFIDKTKKNSQTIKERDFLKSSQNLKSIHQSYTPKKEVSSKISNINNEKPKQSTNYRHHTMETNNEKNGADFGNKKNKNNKDFHPQYPFNIEKENLDLERIHSSFTKNTINSYPCLDLLNNSIENKKIIEGLYKNCIEEKTLEIPNISIISKNLSSTKYEEKDYAKKLNNTSEDSKFSSFAYSMPNGESICFPFVENSEKISFNTKNFNKPHDLDNKCLENEKKSKISQFEYVKFDKNLELPKKHPDYMFSFNHKGDEKVFSLKNERILTSEKYFNLK